MVSKKVSVSVSMKFFGLVTQCCAHTEKIYSANGSWKAEMSKNIIVIWNILNIPNEISDNSLIGSKGSEFDLTLTLYAKP